MRRSTKVFSNLKGYDFRGFMKRFISPKSNIEVIPPYELDEYDVHSNLQGFLFLVSRINELVFLKHLAPDSEDFSLSLYISQIRVGYKGRSFLILEWTYWSFTLNNSLQQNLKKY